MSTDTEIHALCSTLADAGIWLQLKDETTLVAGPTALVRRHPDLITRMKACKPGLIACLQATLAHSLFGAKDDDPRFESDICPDCQQQVYIIMNPRRLSAHRLPGDTTVCPGSDRAQQVVAAMLMQSFVDDRCHTQHAGALVTWTALRGALGAWCTERQLLLPPPAYLWAWLDARYTRQDVPQGPAWQGLSLALVEWFGDDDVPEKPVAQTPYQAAKRLVLKA